MRTLVVLLLAAVAAGPALALVTPESTPVSQKGMRHPDLHILNVYKPATELPAHLRPAIDLDLAVLRVAPAAAYLDLRGGRWGTLLPVEPLLPGTGVGNQLRWEDFGGDLRGDEPALRRAAWDAFVGYLEAYRPQLDIDLAELTDPGYVAVHDGGDLVQIVAPRVVRGVPVRDAFLTATLNHGNLILLGARNWGDVEVATTPTLGREQAQSVVAGFMGEIGVAGTWRRPFLELVPMARGAAPQADAPGDGFSHRLVWVLSPEFDGDLGRWEALVDAHSGEVLAFQDTAHYATARRVLGGVYPVSNDGTPPDGVEQAAWPMPLADLSNNGVLRFADPGGNLKTCVDGALTTTLDGVRVRILDVCGPISETSAGTTLGLGTSGGTDCTVPAGHSPGDTHASRSGYFELNQIIQQGLGYLPNNAWLNDQIPAVMNINDNCNAFWNGESVNFFRSGGPCRNTGEIAGIFDHEWGHGMDNNGVNPNIANPGEGIADIHAAIRLNTSCMGRGFFLAGNCSGYGDACTDCSGVRDIDFAKHTSGLAMDVTRLLAICPGGTDPCAREIHCAGQIYGQAVWDLFKRDLVAGVFNYDDHRALEIATRLSFLGSGPVGQWYQCVQGSGGCPADSGYMNYLAVDDDNGDLTDGTPHMTAIFDAFDRHGIACSTPTVQDFGCAGAPTTAPVVTGAPLDKGANLSWPAVVGATKYGIYRTDGVFGCSFGKIKVGETTGTSFIDNDLLNGRPYYYTVAGIGAHDSCIGPMSSCTTVIPAAGVNLAVDSGGATLTSIGGDRDAFVDNCEAANLIVPLVNTGTGSLTNVRVLAVDPISHPGITILTPLPLTVAASLADCAAATASILFQPDGLAALETLEFRVDATADELGGEIRSEVVRFSNTEGDFQHFATRTFNFEASTEGWNVVSGTFNRTNVGGGGNGTSFYLASSSFLGDQCDQVHSPLLRLAPTSTLSLYNQFDIEPFFPAGGVWYDRANVGLFDLTTGRRTPKSPDGGRLYNASGPNGTCGTFMQGGWADVAPAWAPSTFSAAALGSAAVTGDLVHLAVHYGTDALLHPFGFHFDEVAVTNVDVQVADAQGDVCTGVLIFADGFESGNLSAWAATVP